MKLDLKFPSWEPQYNAALLEIDREKLLESAVAAETSMRQWLQAIFGRAEADTERQVIEKALLAPKCPQRDFLFLIGGLTLLKTVA